MTEIANRELNTGRTSDFSAELIAHDASQKQRISVSKKNLSNLNLILRTIKNSRATFIHKTAEINAGMNLPRMCI